MLIYTSVRSIFVCKVDQEGQFNEVPVLGIHLCFRSRTFLFDWSYLLFLDMPMRSKVTAASFGNLLLLKRKGK